MAGLPRKKGREGEFDILDERSQRLGENEKLRFDSSQICSQTILFENFSEIKLVIVQSRQNVE